MDLTDIWDIPPRKGKHLIWITDYQWKKLTGKDIPDDAVPMEQEGWYEIELEVK